MQRKCPKCGSVLNTCFWTDIIKPKDKARKTFRYTEPVRLKEDMPHHAQATLRQFMPVSEFYVFSETPEAFTKKDMTEFCADDVGAYCTKCDHKL